MGSPKGSPYCRSSALCRADLPTLQPTLLQRGIPSPRGPYTSASRLVLRLSGGTGIFNPFSIAYAFRPRLRSRLTLIRLTLIRNPWAYGGKVSHLSYRYSCLHFRFQPLHQISRSDFDATGMLPYRSSDKSEKPEASVLYLMPENYRCRTARPVSCYALFE